MRFFAVPAAVFAAVFLPGVAFADPSQELVRLEYRAFAGCDGAPQFLAALRARAPRVRLAGPDEVARNFSVEMTASAGRALARLTIREPNGVETVRELVTKDCREAVDAIALVAALAVDPQALATPEKPAPAKRPPDAAAAASPSAIWRWSLAGAGRTGLAPGPLIGGRLGVEIDSLAERLFSPSLRVWAEYAPSTTFAVQAGSAAFSYAGGTIEICPLTLRFGGGLSSRPCLLADLGAILASGIDVPSARSAARFRMAWGGQARLEWMLSARIGIELDLGCTFPVKRDRYRFDPALIYEERAIGATGSAGITAHFP